ncbi:PepSY domain-containing protein [Geminocystis sp. CENA526]|uniref:PepSY domain-containing protein n=1 Tax=Geminocystis sp. CENA526 TaxID=1355871 RepID=UPI003D6DE14F
MKKTVLALCLLTGISIVPSALADDKPPRNAKPLSEIIRSVENKGYSPIVDVDYDDDDGWEIKAYRNNEKRELKVNPISGDIISDKKDD